MQEDQNLEDRRVRARAQSDLNDIDVLRREPAFGRYFQRRLSEIRDGLAAEVLNGRMDAREREIKQREYLLAKRIAALMEEDEAANRTVVEMRGE